MISISYGYTPLQPAYYLLAVSVSWDFNSIKKGKKKKKRLPQKFKSYIVINDIRTTMNQTDVTRSVYNSTITKISNLTIKSILLDIFSQIFSCFIKSEKTWKSKFLNGVSCEISGMVIIFLCWWHWKKKRVKLKRGHFYLI